MYVCAVDGIVYDLRRADWYGFEEPGAKIHCPACGQSMEGEPKEGAASIVFCYQCGTTFDRGKNRWYGIAYHHPPGT